MSEIDPKQMNILELEMKKELVEDLFKVYGYWFDKIGNIELKRYKKKERNTPKNSYCSLGLTGVSQRRTIISTRSRQLLEM